MIKNIKFLFLAFFIGCAPEPEINQINWPDVDQQTKPWTRWWWHGNAVTKDGITMNLELISNAGIGGVEITPIFGVIGEEDQFIEYLSPEWMDMLTHTLEEAKRLDLGVDMATGTGWPFGGPWIGEEDAPKYITHKVYTVEGGGELKEKIVFNQSPVLRSVNNIVYQLYGIYKLPNEKTEGSVDDPKLLDENYKLTIDQIKQPVESNDNLQALAIDQVRFEKALPLQTLMAYSNKGESIDLTDMVLEDGTLNWIAPEGKWKLIALFQGWHGKMVERAAPGGEGNTIDHFSEHALNTYLTQFDQAFEGNDISYLRAFFNDSYEVDDALGAADWTPLFFDEFIQRRGYDLKDYLPQLFDEIDDPANARIRSDYRETIGELILEKFTRPWKNWAKRKNALVRNQSHGSPANILDLYGAVDIPETEGTDLISIKLASSAAHVTGKNLASSESATWLNEHFLSSLADVKSNLDRYFLGGINHIFYHGTTYSPKADKWPGRLFYAAIHANYNNTWWDDFSTLNRYVSRIQSFLQTGQPANEILLYLPVYDFYSAKGEESIMHFDLSRGEFGNSEVKKNASWLTEQGYSYDFISDMQLSNVDSEGTNIVSSKIPYRVLVIPPCEYMPLETLNKIVEIARNGSSIIVKDHFPTSYAGFANSDNNKIEFQNLINTLSSFDNVHLVTDLDHGLAPNIEKETMVAKGLNYIKRKHQFGNYYFVINQSDQPLNDFITLSSSASSAIIFNPMTGAKGQAEIEHNENNVEVFLQLQPQESCIISTYDHKTREKKYNYLEESNQSITIDAPWQVSFIKGGPELPDSTTINTLDSWTIFGGDKGSIFSGTAIYETTFDLPALPADGWILDLGTVNESARVMVNGQQLGTLIGPSYRVYIDANMLNEKNHLQIQVTNLMANRIAYLDKKKVFWKKFYNVNFPARLAENRVNGLFDASKWEPRTSGLLGPVSMIPVHKKTEFN